MSWSRAESWYGCVLVPACLAGFAESDALARVAVPNAGRVAGNRPMPHYRMSSPTKQSPCQGKTAPKCHTLSIKTRDNLSRWVNTPKLGDLHPKSVGDLHPTWVNTPKGHTPRRKALPSALLPFPLRSHYQRKKTRQRAVSGAAKGIHTHTRIHATRATGATR